MPTYGEKTYWDSRYDGSEEHYDWYLNYAKLKDTLSKYMHRNEDSKDDRSQLKILNVGCGNSDLSENMFDDGYTGIHSIDYSDVVIQKMKEDTRKKNIHFETMDVRKLTFPDGFFDVIIDKGTLDAILCGKDSAVNAGEMLRQCRRVLKPGGVMLEITYGDPSKRLVYLDKPKYDWRIDCKPLEGERYLYILRSPPGAAQHPIQSSSYSPSLSVTPSMTPSLTSVSTSANSSKMEGSPDSSSSSPSSADEH